MSYTYFDKVIFRTPLLPFSNEKLSKPDIDQVLNDFFLDAIFISSIDLYNSIKGFNEGKLLSDKIENSILKYLTRASSRCTPFGLLAGVGIGTISENTISTINLKDKTNYQRHTRLDMDYLDNFLRILNNDLEIRPLLFYYPNKTLYKLIDKYRYVETKLIKEKRYHLTSAIEQNDYLETILKKASNGSSILELAKTIPDIDIPLNDKIDFINELINEQILVSNLEINVTGKEIHLTILDLLDVLEFNSPQNLSLKKYKNCINTIYSLIKEIDANGINNINIDLYAQVLSAIENLTIPYNKKYLLQTDLIIKTNTNDISNSIAEDALKLVSVVSRLTPKNSKTSISKFGERFYEKWENNQVPLSLALDPEYGISYPIESSESFNINTFVDDIATPMKDGILYSHEYDPVLTKFWFQKYFDAISNNQNEIVLSDSDIDLFPLRTDELPNTISVMLNVLQAGDNQNVKNRLHLKSAGGSSAANILARFCHADEGISQYCEEVIKKEMVLESDKILAEIIHLPEARLGNILARPKMYDYEICYLSKSTTEEKYQISINDLAIKLIDNRIVLFSTKHNKEVIPRLTNAHNFKHKNLPIYQFLCDLQFQDRLSHVGIDLGLIENYCNYIPRISYNGNLIIQPAKWIFSKKDFLEITLGPENEMLQKFTDFKQKWKIPDLIALTEGDNELVIDTTEKYSILMFIKEVKRKERILMLEVLWNESNNLISSPKGFHLNEVLLGFYKNKKTIQPEPSFFYSNTQSKHNEGALINRYYPNNKWLNIKFYLGHNNAENLLLKLESLNNALLDEGYIQKWFFIRFNDPQFHLRIRYLTETNELHHKILAKINTQISQFLSTDTIWRYQIDTYTPEIERYGIDTIEIAESIFHQDSKAILQLLRIISDDEGIKRWIVGIKNIDMYLNLFDFTLTEKIEFTENLKNHFAKEFNSNKFLKKQIDKKYGDSRKEIETWLFQKVNNEKRNAIEVAFLNREKQLKPIVAFLLNTHQRNRINKWLSSYIHMSTNRLINSKSRLHEFLLYELLNRAYLSYSWKLKSSN